MAHPEQYLNGIKYYLNKKFSDEKEKLPFNKDSKGFSNMVGNCMKVHSNVIGNSGTMKQVPYMNIMQRSELSEGLHDKGEYLAWAKINTSTDFGGRYSDSTTHVD